MGLRIVHDIGRHIDVLAQGTTLARYSYAPRTPAAESPKPFLHPVRTLAGRAVTGFRPHDHPWHTGIALSFSHVSGQNFWGGPTYVTGRGYVPMDNCGAILHTAWNDIALHDREARLIEQLAWTTSDGQRWLDEQRLLRVCEVDPADGSYAIDIRSALRNVSGRSLAIGSPASHGRAGAGYGGWFWRGPRSFSDGGRVVTPAGMAPAAEAAGTPAEWLAYIGRRDEDNATSTLIFIDHPTSARHPTKWFVRTEEYAGVSFAFMFDEELDLTADAELALVHRIVIADGEWSGERIRDRAERYLARERVAAT